MTKNYVTLLGKLVKSTTETVDGKDVKKDLFLCKTTCGKNFFTNERIGAGVAISLTQRKAGDKYVGSDGTEQVVKKNGFNFDGIIGRASDIGEIVATKLALAEIAEG